VRVPVNRTREEEKNTTNVEKIIKKLRSDRKTKPKEGRNIL